jgi:hypothetical protein
LKQALFTEELFTEELFTEELFTVALFTVHSPKTKHQSSKKSGLQIFTSRNMYLMRDPTEGR